MIKFCSQEVTLLISSNKNIKLLNYSKSKNKWGARLGKGKKRRREEHEEEEKV